MWFSTQMKSLESNNLLQTNNLLVLVPAVLVAREVRWCQRKCPAPRPCVLSTPDTPVLVASQSRKSGEELGIGDYLHLQQWHSDCTIPESKSWLRRRPADLVSQTQQCCQSRALPCAGRERSEEGRALPQPISSIRIRKRKRKPPPQHRRQSQKKPRNNLATCSTLMKFMLSSQAISSRWRLIM